MRFLAGPKYLNDAVSSQNIGELIVDDSFLEEVQDTYLKNGGIMASGGNNDKSSVPSEVGGQLTDTYTNLYDDALYQVYNKRKNEITGSLSGGQSYDPKTDKINTNKKNDKWPYQSLYIDTIDYNYWLNKKNELIELRYKMGKD